ncbi:DUF7344 domain-containing protein [Haloarchaeobius iranensis]|uniref:DUF7344 domain-containing protein n=1 Tax=Haloarchaeobius iranensis TaxID=996166 RepID=A0A1G9UEG0_9EURY|nr:hypothetical protein [Haloarchaeobius iranensis]SDM58292.1 hypothetical protein SAMN05192554_10484 [Haloarchaeobius iranensis]
MSISTPAISRTERAVDATALEEGEIHSVLSNERRRLVLKQLRRNGGASTLRELSESIAAEETGESPPPRNIRDSVYASLHQTHLPKLDGLGIVKYDSNTKSVALTDLADELVPYTAVMSNTGLPWYQHYLLLGLAAMASVIAADLGVPLLADVGPIGVALVFSVAMITSLLVQLYTGTRPLQRLGQRVRDGRTN